MQRHEPVLLNVYTLHSFRPYERYLSWLGLGAYHTGIQIYGEEYSFGYHQFDYTGIFRIAPRTAPMCDFKETLTVGYTNRSYDEVQDIIRALDRAFVGSSYNIYTRNCNHFTSEMCQILTGASIPGYVNRLAVLGRLVQCFVPVDASGIPTSNQEQFDEHISPSLQEATYVPFSGEGFALHGHSEISNSEPDVETKRLLLAESAQRRARQKDIL